MIAWTVLIAIVLDLPGEYLARVIHGRLGFVDKKLLDDPDGQQRGGIDPDGVYGKFALSMSGLYSK